MICYWKYTDYFQNLIRKSKSIWILQSVLRKNPNRIKMLFNIFSYSLNCSVGIYFFDFRLLLIKCYDRPGLVIENLKSLNNCFFIIVRSSTCLTPFHQSFFKLLFSAFKVQYRLEIYPLCHYLFPNIHILLTSWETVKQVSSTIIVSFYFFLNDLDHKITWDQFSLLDYCINLFSKFRSCFYLLSQKISSGEMGKLIFFN